MAAVEIDAPRAGTVIAEHDHTAVALRHASTDAFLKLNVGDDIHITYENDGKFYMCRINEISYQNFTCNVTYEGGEEEEDDVTIDRIYIGAPASGVMAPLPEAPAMQHVPEDGFKKHEDGDQCQIIYNGDGSMCNNITYDIEGKEEGVTTDHICGNDMDANKEMAEERVPEIEQEKSSPNALLLFAVDADKTHTPQAFRMRSDQLMKQFARCYAIFRSLSAETAAKMQMLALGHGVLNPEATAAFCGLSNGDQIIFSNLPAKTTQQAEESSTAVRKGPKLRKARAFKDMSISDEALGLQHRRHDARRAVQKKRRGRGNRRNPALLKKPLTPVFAFIHEHRIEIQEREDCQGRHGVCKKGAELYKALADEDRDKYEKKYQHEKTVYDAWAASEEGKALLAHAKEQGNIKRFGRRAVMVAKALAKPAENPVQEPDVPANQMRTSIITGGPAKGWKVIAWFKDAPHERIHWQMVSPGRGRAFCTFGALRRRAGEAVYAHIYTAVRPGLLRKINEQRFIGEGLAHRTFRKAMTQAFHEDENVTTPPKKHKKKRSFSVQELHLVEPQEAMPNAKYQSPLMETPQKQDPDKKRSICGLESSLMPPPLGLPPKMKRSMTTSFTQIHKTTNEGSTGEMWKCECRAHLKLHPRCVQSQERQPILIHLSDRMMIGRNDMCDVVLDSKRTPGMISRSHALLQHEDGIFNISDANSVNGVLINGKKVDSMCQLTHGDVVTFGVPTPNPEFDYVFQARSIKKLRIC